MACGIHKSYYCCGKKLPLGFSKFQLGELILFWHDRYGIPVDYHEDMWDVSQDALDGTPGVWTHVSYRPYPEKFDCHPQPELISMLRTLKSIAS